MRWILAVSLGMSLCLTACSMPFTSAKAPVIEELTRTPMEKIIISELDIFDRPYTLLGDVSAKEASWVPMKSPSKEALNTKLQEEAYQQHADAIIFVTYKTDKSAWHGMATMEATGKAVKFRY